MKNQKGYTIIELVWFFIVIFGVFGWFANINKLSSMGLDELSIEFILRVVGIPMFPIGMVLGYLH